MKLRSLTLTNVRKFANQTASITGIGDGVTVVAQANEFGKSTFFDALHALFFLKYGAATREVKALQPSAGGAVRVAAQIELPAGLFTVQKSFLAQKRAQVMDAAGKVIALDDEAEQWIARLMDTGLEGPAGLLWVRQGITALEPLGSSPADKTKLLDARRDLLSSVAGEIDMVTGGRRMDRVIEAATAALARLATKTGRPVAKGPWSEAEQELEKYTARHAELSQTCKVLSAALGQRRQVAARLEVLEAPDMRAGLEAALAKATQEHDAARAHADKLAQAADLVKLKQLEQDAAQATLDGLIAAATAFEATGEQIAETSKALEQATVKATEAEALTISAQAALTEAGQALDHAVAARDRAQKGALLANAQDKHSKLAAQLAQVETKRAEAEKARAVLSALRVTPQALQQIEAAQTALERAQAEARSGGVQMRLHYDGTARITSEAGVLEAGAHRVAHAQTFDLPGIGRMVLDPGDAAADLAAVMQAQTRLDAALAAVGVADIAAARVQAARRAEAQTALALLENILETLAPDGVEAVQAAVATALAEIEALGVVDDASPAAELPKAVPLEPLQEAQLEARAQYDRSRDGRDYAHAALVRAQAGYDGAQQAQTAAAAAYGDPDSFDARKAEAARAFSAAQVATADAQDQHARLQSAAPDLITAQADLARARSAISNMDEELAQLRTQLTDLSATIRTRAEDGVEEKRDEAEGRMQAAAARAARLAHEVKGLTLLLETLRAKRGAAQEAYFGPIQQELAPLLALLHDGAALSFDPASMLPQGLARDGLAEPVEMLSGGTQEQIAILTRLAFARLFAKQGKPMPIILDDALVYSDDTRITAMFTALHRVAADQQVIVFSCRQMAFAGLGGTRPVIEIATDAMSA
ncbi:MAG: AAA family ATPase [Sulfitobacter sp.]